MTFITFSFDKHVKACGRDTQFPFRHRPIPPVPNGPGVKSLDRTCEGQAVTFSHGGLYEDGKARFRQETTKDTTMDGGFQPFFQ